MSNPDLRRARSTPPHTMRRWPLPRSTSAMIEQLRAELGTGKCDVERFADRLRREGTPIIEPDDQAGWARYTFVWIGPTDHGIVLQLNHVSDPLDVEDTMLERIEGSHVHALTLRLPDYWQGSYLFSELPRRIAPTLHRGVDLDVRAQLMAHARADPFAREHMPSKPTDASMNLSIPAFAVARGPKASALRMWKKEPLRTVPLPSIASPVTGSPLKLHRWSSPGVGPETPAVLLTDGEVWAERFPVAAEISARLGRGEFPPVHVVFLESGGPRQRAVDYTAGSTQQRLLLEGVRESIGVDLPPGRLIVAGQSFGGLFAMLAAVRHPDLVLGAVAQSPSLWWPSPLTPWDPRGTTWFDEQAVRAAPGAPVLLEVGALEHVLTDRVRAAAALLETRDALIGAAEHPGGHDVLQWQTTIVDHLHQAIEATRFQK